MNIFKDCYADINDGKLLIGNEKFERNYILRDGELIPGTLLDKVTGKAAAMEAHDAIVFPFGKFDSVSIECREENYGKLSETFLAVTVIMKNKAAVQKFRLEVFPQLPFFTSRYFVTPKTNANNGFIPEFDTLESFTLPTLHCAVTVMELFDKSDHCDTLLTSRKVYPYPPRYNGYRGDIFVLEPTADTPALLIAKNAPVGSSHLNRPEHDLTVMGKQICLCGSGVDYSVLQADVETEYYGTIVGIGNADELLAGHRELFRRLNKGEGALYIMANTWGDRNCEKALCDEFLREELKAAEEIGIDVLQIDDGWEKGAIEDPDCYMDHIWEGYHKASEDYWSVDEKRFPNGFAPVAEEAKKRNIKLGLWFSPDSADDFANWRTDAEIIRSLSEEFGIRYFKLDGVMLRSKTGDKNYTELVKTLCQEGYCLQLDSTAGDRFSYHCKPQYWNLFVENRYTDNVSYYPYRTLHNLWQLSGIIPSRAMQFEVLNPRRNQKLYGEDIFAPDYYEMDYLFATVMVSNPLMWFELSHLEPQDVDALKKIITAWKPHAKAIYNGDVCPIGEEPNGRSDTGFWVDCGSEGYFVLLHEKNCRESSSYRVPKLAEEILQLEEIASNGGYEINNKISADGIIEVCFTRQEQYIFLRYHIDLDKAERK